MTSMLRIVRVNMEGIWKYLTNYMSPYSSVFESKEPERPLGRWSRDGDVDLKADYANMDSCGDILCGKPDHFKNKR